ncbi:MAG TPA: hypothetical protein VFB34_09035 [Chloroflexota bacterium]|nr:hypothetical protein [Chloroflexota bacterium]
MHKSLATPFPPPVTVGGVTYERIPVRTHLIHVKEPLVDVLKTYVTPVYRPGDVLVLSEKSVAISQGRVIHRSLVRPGILATLIVKGVKKYEDDVGFSDPAKMQVAIIRAGWWRMLAATIGGSITRLAGRHGDFYRIAGNRVSEIDGFNPHTVKPFNEFAMLGPEDPPRDAQQLEDETGWPVVIVDANNVNVEVIGVSRGVSISKSDIRLAMLDNPLGQGEEQTPIVLVRRHSG